MEEKDVDKLTPEEEFRILKERMAHQFKKELNELLDKYEKFGLKLETTFYIKGE